jgi:hypothetical protein
MIFFFFFFFLCSSIVLAVSFVLEPTELTKKKRRMPKLSISNKFDTFQVVSLGSWRLTLWPFLRFFPLFFFFWIYFWMQQIPSKPITQWNSTDVQVRFFACVFESDFSPGSALLGVLVFPTIFAASPDAIFCKLMTQFSKTILQFHKARNFILSILSVYPRCTTTPSSFRTSKTPTARHTGILPHSTTFGTSNSCRFTKRTSTQQIRRRRRSCRIRQPTTTISSP